MKLRNKKTGQEGNFIINADHFECVDLDGVPKYNSLAELNEEWTDHEDSENYWFIDDETNKLYREACDAMKRMSNKGHRYASQENVYDDLTTVQKLIDGYKGGVWRWRNENEQRD